MPETPIYGWPVPEGTDIARDAPVALNALAEAIEETVEDISDISGYTELMVTLDTSGTVTLDLAVANVFEITPSDAVTIAFDNPPDSGRVAPFTLIVRNSDHALTWPGGTKFLAGSPPALDGETWISGVLDDTDATVGLSWKGVA